jgi:hypothetical protein
MGRNEVLTSLSVRSGQYDLADLDDGPSPEAGSRLILAFMNIGTLRCARRLSNLLRGCTKLTTVYIAFSRLSEYPATAFAR